MWFDGGQVATGWSGRRNGMFRLPTEFRFTGPFRVGGAMVLVAALMLTACRAEAPTQKSSSSLVHSASSATLRARSSTRAQAEQPSPYVPQYGDVVFLGPQLGWVDGYTCATVGCPAFALKTTDGGKTWTETVLPSMVAGAMTFLNANDGWLSGSGPAVCGTNCRYVLMATTDGGASWHTVYQSQTALDEVQFVSPTLGFASTQGSFNQCAAFLKTTDGGRTWTPVQGAPVPMGSYGFQFVSASRGWLVGQSCVSGLAKAREANPLLPPVTGQVGIFVTTDGGAHWVEQWSIELGDAGGSGVDMWNGTDGWAYVTNQSECAMGGCWASLYQTTNGGATWTEIQSQSHWTASLTGDAGGFMARSLFISPEVGWITFRGGAATSGAVGVTTDGGVQWAIRGPSGYWSPQNIAPISATQAWVVGVRNNLQGPTDPAFLAHTNDGGKIWSTVIPDITHLRDGG